MVMESFRYMGSVFMEMLERMQTTKGVSYKTMTNWHHTWTEGCKTATKLDQDGYSLSRSWIVGCRWPWSWTKESVGPKTKCAIC